MEAPRHILVLRFSALGDVAMTVPVLKNLLAQHPELKITMVSHERFAPLFNDAERLQFFPMDLKAYSGIRGLWRLSRTLKKQADCDALADLHDVLRTKLLRFFLRGIPRAVIDKGRKEKEELTRAKNKKLRQLKTTFERYSDVFRLLGLSVTMDIQTGLRKKQSANCQLPTAKLIGIAPFAKHSPKQYPADKMGAVINLFAADPANEILIFGAPNETKPYAEGFARDNVKPAPVNDLAGDLVEMRKLDVMVSMDSANMHLASLVGIPVISIWGGTHPFLGFAGWGNLPENMLQADLPCRPSSVFGNRPCSVHGAAGCMQPILPETVVARCFEILQG